MKLLKKNKAAFYAIAAILFVLLLAVLFLLQLLQSKKNVEQTSAILLAQMTNLISENEEKAALLLFSHKETYKTRSQSVSYILDHNPEIEGDIEELKKIAELLKVDEIHLFDESGTIYAGTTPEYYGYSFASGEQIGYFEPMLHDKTLVMCQDVTPNTADGKPMMYAMCWNEAGTRMLQIGIDPARLMAELGLNSVGDIMQGMPSYPGITLLLAYRDSGEIVGSTADLPQGTTLEEIGIVPGSSSESEQTISGIVNGDKSYYTLGEYGNYYIAVVQSQRVVHRDIPLILATVAIYLLLSISIASFFIKRLSAYADTEEQNASTDYMTGFFNRRAYDKSIQLYSEEPHNDNFVYVSMDLNGLKRVNDSFGHEVGDEFIKAAARCMAASFGSYGKLFRTGGDEFAAILFADDDCLRRIKSDFEERIERESLNSPYELAVSCAYVCAKDFPDSTLPEIAKIADLRMYEEKKAYYSNSGVNCRGCEFGDLL